MNIYTLCMGKQKSPDTGTHSEALNKGSTQINKTYTPLKQIYSIKHVFLKKKYSIFIFPRDKGGIWNQDPAVSNLSFGCLVVNQYILFPVRIQIFKNLFPVIPQLCSYFELASFLSMWWPSWPLADPGLCFNNSSCKIHSHWSGIGQCPLLYQSYGQGIAILSLLYICLSLIWRWDHCHPDHMKGE